ncbi:hypothetical protein D3C81_1273550 [compost metagenome]
MATTKTSGKCTDCASSPPITGPTAIMPNVAVSDTASSIGRSLRAPNSITRLSAEIKKPPKPAPRPQNASRKPGSVAHASSHAVAAIHVAMLARNTTR